MATEVIETMKGYFGEGTIPEGNKHSFLGSNITIIKVKNIQIKMKDHMQELVETFELYEDAKL